MDNHRSAFLEINQQLADKTKNQIEEINRRAQTEIEEKQNIKI